MASLILNRRLNEIAFENAKALHTLIDIVIRAMQDSELRGEDLDDGLTFFLRMAMTSLFVA